MSAEAELLDQEVARIRWVLNKLKRFATDGDTARYLSDASVFLEMMGYAVIGWQWLKMASKSLEMLSSENLSAEQKAFYEGKIHVCRFYFKYEMPHSAACAAILTNESALTSIQNFNLFN